MSGHGHHDAGADLHADHDDHDETTSDDFPADEPHSPDWLPLLGGGLFLAAIFGFVLLGSDDKDDKTAAEGAKAAPVAATARPALRPTPGSRPAPALPPGHVRVPTPGE